MRAEDEENIRNAALDLALNTDTSQLTCEGVAARAGVPVETLKDFCHSNESLLRFILDPLTTDLDNRLRLLPIHQAPTYNQRRQVLAAMLDAGINHPRQAALIIRIRTNPNIVVDHRHADRFSYQAGVRLLGTEYDTDPDAMTRVNLTTDLLCLAMCSGRHDLTSAHEREVLIASALAALSPAAPPPDRSGTPERRRWTDSGATDPRTDPQT